MRINAKHKDRLFRLVFQKKEDLLTLYNAINHSNYQNADELDITTLDDVIYIGMKNDISFMIDSVLNLWEHQSTINPNLPLRGLFYFSDLYRKYVDTNEINIYSSKQQMIPLPQYIVFYNGQEKTPENWELKLSDAFIFPEHVSSQLPCMEITVQLLNINHGKNRAIMQQCQKLKEYAEFIEEIRKQQNQGLDMQDAVDTAVRICIKRGILHDLLSSHRAEVLNVILTEYDEQKYRAMEKKEWIAEGEKRGISKGKASAVIEILEEHTPVPENLKRQIMAETDESILKNWLKLAARSSSLEEFVQKMK